MDKNNRNTIEGVIQEILLDYGSMCIGQVEVSDCDSQYVEAHKKLMELCEELHPSIKIKYGMFRKRLAELINELNLESLSNTQDFVLAEHLTDCLASFNESLTERDELLGIDHDNYSTVESNSSEGEVEIDLVPKFEFTKIEEYYGKPVEDLAEAVILSMIEHYNNNIVSNINLKSL